MAAGIPAIVSNRASLPEVVGNAAFIVEPHDTDDIVSILINLHQNPDTRNEWINKGLSHVQNFTWDNAVQKLYRIIKSV